MKTAQGHPAVAVVRTFHFDTIQMLEHTFDNHYIAVCFTQIWDGDKNVIVSPITVVEVQR